MTTAIIYTLLVHYILNSFFILFYLYIYQATAGQSFLILYSIKGLRCKSLLGLATAKQQNKNDDGIE